ncbi:MAG: hypothetical protein NT088_06385 [Candidatus Omnitrophica bacterium]|nr:hypothetical protein [Candidatus Omnitrophota bacterium]
MKNNKGIVLFIVLGTILVIIVLANILLGLITSQSRITHHQVSRIQAFYAAQAGLNYAREMLRIDNPNWKPSPDDAAHTVTNYLCRDCSGLPSGSTVSEPKLPPAVKSVEIQISGLGSGLNGVGRQIKATVNYAPST